jgi:hypothetical protein
MFSSGHGRSQGREHGRRQGRAEGKVTCQGTDGKGKQVSVARRQGTEESG